MPLVDPVTMASAPTKPTTATAAATALQPVLIQQTPAGQAGRYVHPVVLLALFGSQFNALVNDPVRASAWLAIGSAMAPWDETLGGLAGALFGAWLGAVPIPLDWDREWQKWPVTILYGLYAGYVAGKVTGGFLLFGKRMFSRVERADKEE
ncbi:glycosylphosphatidylinositol anchor biosynthesis protein [Verticillium alfalfae VaMs.102]|uniref:Glycosylphosphatidylinositol anchor biosynthesis protein n=1 Tax=Verticillium alfalfae (strain VaMs.102 / ATCC MYA-4576 / FGSC 10136) TaxID=526221 RepID=C9S6W4_VERA1|nr:glycosylphosphatidylinositol anchor biosynthesis protein [Verticillium alfalfae VaMs.102]EEY14575.1 glycosylphosphatidylinositol anchor biosynthesis protein [Verticillium alfalfae VaMs.102]